MNFSNFFIKRPIFATVLALLFVVAGVVSLGVLPVAQYPDITPPTVMVKATYPGANAQTVAQTVGVPIEQQVNGVEGMLYMSSSSSASGEYALTVTFEVGTDVDMATVMVQNRVNVAMNLLPEAVRQQGVTVRKQASNILMFLTLTGDSLYDGLYLSNYATLNLVDRLSRVPGVGGVNVLGAGEYSMRVWLDPEAMRIRGITPQQIFQAVSAQNMEVSAGYVGQPVGTGDDNAFQYSLAVRGRLESPEEFGNIVLRVEADGRMLRLRDVAVIDLGSRNYGTVSMLNGRPTAAIAVYQLPGANALEVVERVRTRMTELNRDLPPGVECEVTLDTTEVVNSSIHEVLKTFAEATVLVVLVIFFFLQNWRAVIIPCITIPVSLIGTLAVMELLGFSINMLSLFGLVLAIAIVVDDAIVVVENTTRLIQSGKYATVRQATEVAMGEITGPIVGVALVMLAVFIPTILIGGISGQLYKQFALTIAASTVISAFNSLTLSPALCALLLKPASGETKNRLFRSFDRVNDYTQRVFDRSVDSLLRHRWVAGGSFLVLSGLAFLLFSRWPSTFLPEEDDGYLVVSVQLPPAASLSRTTEACNRLTGLLLSYPEVENCLGIAGFSIASGDAQTNAGTFFVILKDWKQRRGHGHTAAAVVERFNAEAYGLVQQAQAFATIPPAIPGLGTTGGLQFELEDRHALGTAEMQKALDQLMENYRREPSLAALSSVYQAEVPQYFLQIDRDKVKVMDLVLSDVFATLSYYMGQAYVNDFVRFGRTYQVLLAAGEQSQRVIDDVLRLSVTNSKGEVVPFSSFMSVEERLGMNTITRYNMYDAATVTCNVADGFSSGEAIEAVGRLMEEELGDQFGYEWTSVAYQEVEAGSSTVWVFAMALLVAYLVLCAQYESWSSPVAAVMGVPIALLGAVSGCWVMGLPVSIYTEIGIVLLIALAAKNGILIVEFARDYRLQGNSIRESARQAARVRLRPILMTSLSFVFGVMPLLFATGAGSASERALGAAVVFGMAVNTVVATLYIPNGYEWMQTLQEWGKKKPSAP